MCVRGNCPRFVAGRRCGAMLASDMYDVAYMCVLVGRCGRSLIKSTPAPPPPPPQTSSVDNSSHRSGGQPPHP